MDRKGARLQSLSPYMESGLSLTIFSYIAAAICTKGLVFFGIGALLTAFCLLADKALLPYLAGFFVWGISFGLYVFIPAGSPAALLKYCNPEGFLKTGFLYGGYLNFNVFGLPVSSLALAWIGILFLTAGARFSAYWHSFAPPAWNLRNCGFPCHHGYSGKLPGKGKLLPVKKEAKTEKRLTRFQ